MDIWYFPKQIVIKPILVIERDAYICGLYNTFAFKNKHFQEYLNNISNGMSGKYTGKYTD